MQVAFTLPIDVESLTIPQNRLKMYALLEVMEQMPSKFPPVSVSSRMWDRDMLTVTQLCFVSRKFTFFADIIIG